MVRTTKTLGSRRTAQLFLSGACAVAFSTSAATAQESDGLNGFLFVGPAITPEYEGADEYDLVPGFVGQAEYGGRTVLVTPSDLDVDLLPSARYTLGPSFSFRFAREDVEDAQVDRLNDVDAAVEIGVNFGLNYGMLFHEADGLSLNLRLTQDVADGHGGLVGRVSANYSYPITERFRLTGGVELSAVTEDYADAYFDVSAAEAARSGLSAYDAGGGLKDVKFTVLADYAINERWGVGAYGSYARLVGDFADSSVVDEAGSASQFFGMLGVQYRF